MDTAKVVSDRLGNVLINIQTVPLNCAAFTTKSIVYSETHEMIASVREKSRLMSLFWNQSCCKMHRLSTCVRELAIH
ncbi:MAG: hypothetical protein PUD28_00810 [Lactobacillus sp.]|nr:hypothetical protein [Lactobacillus sp.]